MSLLDRFYDRLVTIEKVTDDTVDDYGDDIKSVTSTFTTRTRREQLTATEDISDRDQQARTFVYIFDDDVDINGRDRILDGDLVLEVLGAPDVLSQRNRSHHIEVRAYIIEG